MDFYSVRMRANTAGKHISGAEDIVSAKDVAATCAALAQRALDHPKGSAENTTITVEALKEEEIWRVPQVSIKNLEVESPEHAHTVIRALLRGHTPHVERIIETTFAVRDMRGAMLIDAAQAERLEPDLQRGIRVSHIGAKLAFSTERVGKNAALEAVILASKVAAHPDVLAELCISDDPAYTTGYVCVAGTYHRVPHIKEPGSRAGGRAFIIRPGADVLALIEYLESQPVLVEVNSIA